MQRFYNMVQENIQEQEGQKTAKKKKPPKFWNQIIWIDETKINLY